MTQKSTLERRIFQFFILLLAIICFVPGGVSTFGGMNASAIFGGGEAIFADDNMLRGFADNQYRFGFGVFLAQGFVLIFFLRNINQHTTLFRFAALALFVGGLGRLANIMEYGIVDSQVVGPTVIELLVVPMFVLWHNRIIKPEQVN